jgi:hypothetical protein
MAARKTLDSIPALAPGEAACIGCRREEWKGGDNSCPTKELRPAYREKGIHNCSSFLGLTPLQRNNRIGVPPTRKEKLVDHPELF